MEWALTWELLKLCKLLNIYAPKASTSAWDFTFNNFFFWTYIYSTRAYLYQIRVSNIYTYIQYPITILNIQIYLNLLFLRCIIITNNLQLLDFTNVLQKIWIKICFALKVGFSHKKLYSRFHCFNFSISADCCEA